MYWYEKEADFFNDINVLFNALFHCVRADRAGTYDGRTGTEFRKCE